MIGSVMKESEDGVFLDDKYQGAFIAAMLIGIVMIFLNALDWLDIGYEFLKNNWSNEWVASVILMLIFSANKNHCVKIYLNASITGQVY